MGGPLPLRFYSTALSRFQHSPQTRTRSPARVPMVRLFGLLHRQPRNGSVQTSLWGVRPPASLALKEQPPEQCFDASESEVQPLYAVGDQLRVGLHVVGG